MSGRLSRPGATERPSGDVRARLPLLDRLIDEEPDRREDPPLSAAQAHAALLRGVRRDLEALLNARRPWRSLPEGYAALNASPLGYGLADFAAGTFNQPGRRERLRAEIQAALAMFERRLSDVRVELDGVRLTDATLRLRIHAQLNADPAPAPIGFDTLVNATTADIDVRPGRDV
jgi:type VI secretion system protein ImpF